MLETHVRFLSQSDMDRLHGSSIELLGSLGVQVDHPRMRALLSDFGCQVEGNVVKFPEAIVEEVVGKMRDPANLVGDYMGILPLKRERIPAEALVVPVATAQATIAHDIDSDELRPATQQDVIDACQVVDSLPGVVTGHPIYIPQDVPEMVRDLYALKVTAQHYPYSDFVEAYSPEVVPYFLEMGRVIRGSDEALKREPPFASWAFATSPFHFGWHGFEIIFMFQDFGLKQGYGVGGVMPMLGASTPLTLSGYLVIQTAEVLACNIMNWILLGRVTGYASGPAILDMKRATASQSGPETLLLDIACLDMQRYYGEPEPMFPYALGADAKFPDVQAGLEKAFSATLAVLAGSRILSAGLGTLYLSGAASLAQLVIDYELCQNLAHLGRGIEVDEAHIGLEMIKKVGIGGSFLAEDHTLKYMRQTLFFPELADRRSISDWRQDRKGMLDHAKDKVRNVLQKGEHPEYLDREQVKELDRIAQRAREKLSH